MKEHTMSLNKPNHSLAARRQHLLDRTLIRAYRERDTMVREGRRGRASRASLNRRAGRLADVTSLRMYDTRRPEWFRFGHVSVAAQERIWKDEGRL
jgi:hypothetical protein